MSLLSPSVRTTQEPGKAFGPPGRQAEVCELEVSRAGSQAPRLLPHPTPRSPQILPARCLQQIPSTIFSSNPTTKSPILQDRAGDRRGTYNGALRAGSALPWVPRIQLFEPADLCHLHSWVSGEGKQPHLGVRSDLRLPSSCRSPDSDISPDLTQRLHHRSGKFKLSTATCAWREDHIVSEAGVPAHVC